MYLSLVSSRFLYNFPFLHPENQTHKTETEFLKRISLFLSLPPLPTMPPSPFLTRSQTCHGARLNLEPQFPLSSFFMLWCALKRPIYPAVSPVLSHSSLHPLFCAYRAFACLAMKKPPAPPRPPCLLYASCMRLPLSLQSPR